VHVSCSLPDTNIGHIRAVEKRVVEEIQAMQAID